MASDLLEATYTKIANYQQMAAAMPNPMQCPLCEMTPGVYLLCTFCRTKTCDKCSRKCETGGCPICVRCWPEVTSTCCGESYCTDIVCRNCSIKVWDNTGFVGYVCDVCVGDDE